MGNLISMDEAPKAEAAAQVVVETHRRVAAFLRGGLTLPKIDEFIAQQLANQGARSCFLGYRPSRRMPAFPSHACLSVNDCVVHGTAASLGRPLRAGDVLKIDIGVWFDGWVGDAAWTYSIGTPDAITRRLMDCGKRALAQGVLELRPGNTYGHWARRVQGIVEVEEKFHLVRGLGGHGLIDRGKPTLHGPPYVSNVTPSYAGEWPEGKQPCEPGTLIAVEPMIAIGTPALANKANDPASQWPEKTADGSMSVHYEHDVLITADGPRVLTHGLEDLPDVVPA